MHNQVSLKLQALLTSHNLLLLRRGFSSHALILLLPPTLRQTVALIETDLRSNHQSLSVIVSDLPGLNLALQD
jgi:hypothetical protein